jgi:hypothetical protein
MQDGSKVLSLCGEPEEPIESIFPVLGVDAVTRAPVHTGVSEDLTLLPEVAIDGRPKLAFVDRAQVRAVEISKKLLQHAARLQIHHTRGW